MPCFNIPSKTTRRIRVLLVDDHILFRNALKNLLTIYPEIEIVGEAANGLEALELIDVKRPDIVCMDRRLPIFSGIDATRRLRLSHPHIKVIGLSASDEIATIVEILAAGAAAYLSKQEVHEKLIGIIRTLYSEAGPLLPE